MGKLNEAEKTIAKAINSLSPGTNENIEKFHNMRDRIRFYIGYENKFRRNLETLYEHVKSELFTIAGTNFYKKGKVLARGMPLKLAREPYNESDRDAIAVYAEGEKIGYVANSINTNTKVSHPLLNWQEKFKTLPGANICFILTGIIR